MIQGKLYQSIGYSPFPKLTCFCGEDNGVIYDEDFEPSCIEHLFNKEEMRQWSIKTIEEIRKKAWEHIIYPPKHEIEHFVPTHAMRGGIITYYPLSIIAGEL